MDLVANSMSQKRPSENDLVFDVGMHTGEDSEFYLKKGCRVVGVEANPDLCVLVQRQLCGYVSSGRLRIVNQALADCERDVTFYLNDQVSEWSTIDATWAERNARLGTSSREVTVRATRLSSLLEAHGTPYYLKIDVEGADLLCLDGLREFEGRPKFISIESQRRSFGEHLHQFALLWTLGYRRFKIVPQHRITTQRCPFPPREGRYVDHRFRRGSSGLFGEELPGKWLDIEEAIAAHRKTLTTYWWFGHGSVLRKPLPRGGRILDLLSGWYDIHAAYGTDGP